MSKIDTIDTSRRGFFGLMAAVPVAARTAAAKMGLGTATSSGAALVASRDTTAGCLAPVGYYDESRELRKHAPEIFSTEARNERRKLRKHAAQIFSTEARNERRRAARHDARILDPDLAALRSVSPNFAYSAQVDRCAARRLRDEQGWIERRLRELAGL